MIILKDKKDKTVITLRLTEEENEKLKRCSALCGLSQTEFIRQLCNGNTPKPEPPKAFWDMMNALYELHAAFEKCIPYYPQAADECREIGRLILDLQEAV